LLQVQVRFLDAMAGVWKQTLEDYRDRIFCAVMARFLLQVQTISQCGAGYRDTGLEADDCGPSRFDPFCSLLARWQGACFGFKSEALGCLTGAWKQMRQAHRD
jgi:hypothetical protein